MGMGAYDSSRPCLNDYREKPNVAALDGDAVTDTPGFTPVDGGDSPAGPV